MDSIKKAIRNLTEQHHRKMCGEFEAYCHKKINYY